MKKLLSIFLVTTLAISMLSGCNGNKQTDKGAKGDASTSSTSSDSSGKVINVTFPTYKIGETTGGPFFEAQIARFNKLYDGKYKITLEQIPQASYKDKMKQLSQQNKLPFLVESGESGWMENYIIKNNKFVDLTSFIDSEPDMKKRMVESSIKYNTTPDGKIVTMPLPVIRPMGSFYNSSVYNPSKPIKDMTIDEFQASLGTDKKLALDTGDNAFFSQLLLSDIIASLPGGVKLFEDGLKTKITDFNSDIWIQAVTKLQDIALKNGADNKIGATATDAMNYFLSQKASVLMNGPWFISQFDKSNSDKWSGGFDGKNVKADLDPGNVLVSTSGMYWYWLPATDTKEEVEVGEAFLKFVCSQDELERWMLSEGGVAPNVNISDDYKEKLKENPYLSEQTSLIDDKTVYINNFGDVVPPSIDKVEFGKLLVKLYSNAITPTEFCKQLTIKAQESLQ